MFVWEVIDIVFFSAPLFCLYLKLVISLWRRRNDYFSAFYRIVLFGGIIDCACFTLFLTFRFTNTNFYYDHFLDRFNHYSFYWSPLKFIVYLTIFLTHTTPLLMAVNRATSLCLPLSYDHIWRNYTVILGATYLIVPTALCWQLLFKPAGFILYGNITDGFVALEYDHSYTFGPRMSTALIWYCLTVSLFTLAFNLICAIKLLKHRFQRKTLRKNNVRMVICAMIVFMNEILVVLSQLIFTQELLDITTTMRIVIPFIFDIHSLMPGFIVICTVPQLRKLTFEKLFKDESMEKSLFITNISAQPIHSKESH